MSPLAITLTCLSTIAFTALAFAGAVLWSRTRSIWASVVAVGFALMLPDQVSRLVEYFRFNALLRGRSDETVFLFHHHAYLQFVSVFGLCVAAVGLVRHATYERAGVS